MDTENTTEIVNDAPTEETVATTSAPLPASIPLGMNAGYQQSLRDFFARPILMKQIRLTAGSTNQPLYELTDLFTSNKMWADKLRGFMGITGTFVIRAQFNAQPFQQGIYMLGYVPMYKEHKYRNGGDSTWLRHEYLVTRSQLPHVKVNIETDTEAVLRIPHKSLCSHYNLFTGLGTWGAVFLSSYLPMANGPNATILDIGLTMWASLEDVDFGAATIPYDSVESQMDTTVQEQKPGPVEKVASTVHKVADVLSAIPVVETVAKPVAWASNIAKGVAHIFGWSKPVNTEPITRIYKSTNMYQNNCEGVDNAFNLGLTTTNKVKLFDSVSRSPMDEMSIAFIKQQSAVFATFGWHANMNTNDLLFQTPISPTAFYQTANTQLRLVTPICGLAQCFSYWRGGLKFTIRLAKTKFHSGRLVISFVPGAFKQTLPMPVNTFQCDLPMTEYVHREIIDIRERNQIDFEVPFVSMFPYHKHTQSTGTLQIHILNPLRAPEMVSESISLAVEVAGSEDFEFAIPREPIMYPASGRHDTLANTERILRDFSSTGGWPKEIFDFETYKVESMNGTAINFVGYSDVLGPTSKITLDRIHLTIDGRSIDIGMNGLHTMHTSELNSREEVNSLKRMYPLAQEINVGNDFNVLLILGRTESFNARQIFLYKIPSNDKDTSQTIPSVSAPPADPKDDDLTQPDVTDDTGDQGGDDGESQPSQVPTTSKPPVSSKILFGTMSLDLDDTHTVSSLPYYKAESQSGLGSTSHPTLSTEMSELCIGEHILSIRQLMMRDIPYHANKSVENVQHFPCRPHMVYACHNDKSVIQFTDYYSYFGACYAYSRGGVVIRILRNSGSTSEEGLDRIELAQNSTTYTVLNHPPSFSFLPKLYEGTSSNTILSAYVPMYNETFGRLNARAVDNDTGAIHPFGQNVSMNISPFFRDPDKLSISRCAAEDTQFAFFLGFPPMRLH